MTVSFNLNGEDVSVEVDPAESLLNVLRDRMGMTGTKEVCNEGECGACTVLVDGKPIDSCIYSSADLDGYQIHTVEGVVTTRIGQLISESLVDAGGIQCGFCTPGIVVTLSALHQKTGGNIDEAMVKRALAGNLCRCTGYSQIVEAAMMVMGREIQS